MSETLRRCSSPEERGQQEARALTCGQPWGRSTSTPMLEVGCPGSRGWAPISPSAGFSPVGPPAPGPLCLQLPLSRPPLSSSPATSSALAWPRRELQPRAFVSSPAAHALVLLGAVSHQARHPALPVFCHTTLGVGLQESSRSRQGWPPPPPLQTARRARGKAPVRGRAASWPLQSPRAPGHCEDEPQWGKPPVQKGS